MASFEVGQERQLVALAARPERQREPREPAHFAQGVEHHEEGAGHGQDVLQEVGGHHAPEAGGGGVDHHDDENRQDGPEPLVAGEVRQLVEHAERDDDLPHGEHAVADADAVERHGGDEGAEGAEPGGRAAAVAELGELHVGEHPRPAPELGQHHRHQHVHQREAPPLPVAGHAVPRHPPRHVERRVHVEGGGRHRGGGEPPRDGAAAHEELRQAAGALAAPARARAPACPTRYSATTPQSSAFTRAAQDPARRRLLHQPLAVPRHDQRRAARHLGAEPRMAEDE